MRKYICGIFAETKKFAVRLIISLVLHFRFIYGTHALFRRFPAQLDGLSAILYCTVTFASTIIMIGACFEIPKSKGIAVAVSGYSVQHITYTLVVFLRLSLGREVYGGWSPFVTYLVFHTAPYLVACLLYFFIVEKPLRQRTEFKEYDLRITLVMLMVIMSNVILSEVREEGMGQPINRFTSYIVCGLYAIITCSLAIFLQYTVGIETKSTTDKNMIERMLELTHMQYDMSKENIDIINMKYHGLRHQINALKDNRLAQDSQDWAEELEKSVSIYDNSTFNSGSSALDVAVCLGLAVWGALAIRKALKAEK